MEIKKLLEEFDEGTIRGFVQKNADHYITKWKVMALKGSKLSWNWAAFLFTIFWLVYRKMYFYAFILFLLNSLVAIPVVGSFISIGIWIGMGMLGNYLYGIYTHNKLLELKTRFTDENVFKMQVAKAGGTSVLAVFITLFIHIILYIILILLLGLFGGLFGVLAYLGLSLK